MSVDGMPNLNRRRRSAVPALASTFTPLSRRSLPKDTIALARWLIGKRLVRRLDGALVAGRIVETEAYFADDPASHSFGGQTLRNRSMFAARGHAYIYRIYGIWFCLNVSAGSVSEGAAVLIRALEPLDNVGLMTKRRAPGGAMEPYRLCRGPGNLTRALGITLAENRLDLTSSRLRIEDRGLDAGRVSWGPRIGIRVAVKRPWRCFVPKNPCVSRGTRRA